MRNIQELVVKIDNILLVLGYDQKEVYISYLGLTRTLTFFTKEDAIQFIMNFDLVNFQNSGNF